MQNTNVEWAHKTWNPMHGCTPISRGCNYCYAARMARRLRAMAMKGYESGFKVTLERGKLGEPLKIKKPSRIFVCSMGDLFHKDVPDEFIKDVFVEMFRANRHTFMVLTKRAERMAKGPEGEDAWLWTKGIWAGVTVEDKARLERLEHLRKVPAVVRFVSFEPLLEDVGELDLTGIHWVIVGGETGAGARLMGLDWARRIRDQAVAAGVPFFFKKAGGVHGGSGLLDGEVFHQFPEVPWERDSM